MRQDVSEVGGGVGGGGDRMEHSVCGEVTCDVLGAEGDCRELSTNNRYTLLPNHMVQIFEN